MYTLQYSRIASTLYANILVCLHFPLLFQMPFIHKNGNEVVNLNNLTSDDLFDLIQDIPTDSEDDLEMSDEDDFITPDAEEMLSNYMTEQQINELTLLVEPSQEDTSEHHNTLANVPELASSIVSSVVEKTPVADEITAQRIETSVTRTEIPICHAQSSISRKVNLLWKKKKLRDVPCNFTGNTVLPAEITILQTPYQYFKYFFNDELFEKITLESVRFSASKNPAKPLDLTKYDIMKYLGICILSSIVSIPNFRMYWNQQVGLDVVCNTMSQKRFEHIRSNLHFNDNSCHNGTDKLFKLRPVIDSLSSNFIKVPMEEMLSVDEQICATKARHHLKQYLPLKPHKWGYKLFVLSGVSGFCYKFEIYTGTENDSNRRLSNEPDLGSSSNVVVRLAREIPRNCFHKLFFDNYYTSIPIINFLAKKGIHSLGTVRRNRIPGCKMPTDNECKKLKRGEFGEFVANHEGTEISNVYWKDNKIVTLLSSFVGSEPVKMVKRYDRKKRERVDIPCPAIVTQYNMHMGGVDLLDSIVGRYKIKMRSRKWYMRLFYHLIDITVINAWLLYRRNNQNKTVMKLADFRLEVASTLCKIGPPTSSKRGRPSENQKNIDLKRLKPNVTPVPTKDVRLDNIGHFPKWNETRLRCKLPDCKAQTFVVCEKCEAALCFNKNNNCFKVFHSN